MHSSLSTHAILVYNPLFIVLSFCEDIYKISTDWVSHRSYEAFGSFVLWSLYNIVADLASHQGVVKGYKKVV